MHDFVVLVKIKTPFNKTINLIRSNNDSEFMYPEFYVKYETIHQIFCVETSSLTL